MAINRNEFNRVTKEHLLQILANTQEEIRKATLYGIQQGNDKKQTKLNLQEISFNELCEELAHCSSVEGTQSQETFQRIKTRLSMQQTQSNVKISSKKTQNDFLAVLKNYVDVYAAIIKQRNHLLALPDDYQSRLQNLLQTFEDIDQQKQLNIVKLDFNSLNAKLNRLDFTLKMIADMLKNNGYLRDEFDFREYTNFSQDKLVQEALKNLPPMQILVDKVQELTNARERNDTKSISAAETSVKKYIDDLELTKTQLQELGDNITQQYRSMLVALNQEQTSLNNAVINTENVLDEVQSISTKLLAMQGYISASGTIYKGYEEINEKIDCLTKSCHTLNENNSIFSRKYWVNANERMSTLGSRLHEKFNLFLQPFMDNFFKIKQAGRTQINDESQHSNLYTTYTRLEALLGKANNLFSIANDQLTHFQLVLATHVPTHEKFYEYLANFIKGHKVEVSVGSTSGTSVGIVAGLILHSAAAIALPFAGAGLGFALGAAIGVLTDFLNEGKREKKEEEKRPSDKLHYPTANFWKWVSTKLSHEEAPKVSAQPKFR